MGGISEKMLAGGCAVHVEALHGEPIFILTGDDAGKTFVAVGEIESDVVFEGEIGIDPRAKRVLRFKLPNVPNLAAQDQVRTEDGAIWFAVRRPGNSFLTQDFELSEVAPGKDT